MSETITLEINGKKCEGRLATDLELKELSEKTNKAITDECVCGEGYCSSAGYEVRCALANDNVCRWFVFENSRCNP